MIDLQRELVKTGYNHSETGSWIDASYWTYRFTITGRDDIEAFKFKIGLKLQELEKQIAALAAILELETRKVEEENKKRYAAYDMEKWAWIDEPPYRRFWLWLCGKKPKMQRAEVDAKFYTHLDDAKAERTFWEDQEAELVYVDRRYAILEFTSKHVPPPQYTLMSKVIA